MKKTTKIIIVAIIVAMLLLGIGYAAIQNITLNISGTAQANPSQASFKVMFTEVQSVSDENLVVAEIIDEINATINVSNLTQKGQTVSATYKIRNVSESLSADLSVAMTNENAEYFVTSSRLEKTSLTSGEETTVTVTIKLIKTPLEESVSTDIDVILTAMPVQPGNEGTSANINNFAHTSQTLSALENINIGDYIDLGNNVVGTDSTSDDWRILYKDDDAGYAYVILADYLPASKVPTESGLDTEPIEYPYSVWSDESREDLLNGLLNDNAWNTTGFANGIEGAIVMGTPSANLIINSYNAKNGTELVYTDGPLLDNKTKDYDLYVCNDKTNCGGCYLADIYKPEDESEENKNYMWIIGGQGLIGVDYYYKKSDGIRPVVAIPLDTLCSYSNGTWMINEL